MTERHVAYRELGRQLMTEALVKQVIPSLRTNVALFAIKQMTNLAIDRLELAANSRRSLLSNFCLEVLEEAFEAFVDVEAAKIEAWDAMQEEMNMVNTTCRFVLNYPGHLHLSSFLSFRTQYKSGTAVPALSASIVT